MLVARLLGTCRLGAITAPPPMNDSFLDGECSDLAYSAAGPGPEPACIAAYSQRQHSTDGPTDIRQLAWIYM